MTAKIHFDDDFCEQVAELGIPRNELVRHLRILRENPTLGLAITPEIPAYREWKIEFDQSGLHRVGYFWSEVFNDIDMSYIIPIDPNSPTDDEDESKKTLEWLILLSRLAAMIARFIKEILSISS